MKLDAAVPYHGRTIPDVLRELEADPDQGLGAEQVSALRERYGPNQLRKAGKRSAWLILIDQFKSIVVVILAAAGALALAFGEHANGVAIAAVILVNTGIGFISEWKAVRSMEALRRLGRRSARVLRDGRKKKVPVEKLVPGDVVLFQGGELVPADIRLIEAESLRVSEAALTGESVPALKTLEPVEEDRPLAERTNMLFKGTTVVEGSAKGVVVVTGMGTELGKIAGLTERAESEATPLEGRLNRLAGKLAWLALGSGGVISVLGLLSGQPPFIMVETAIALGVAAIPEGLPIVSTIALARGMWVMARRQALIKQLNAVETLGATRVIFTDKTGTLTENRMDVRRVITPHEEIELSSDDATPGKKEGRGTLEAENRLFRRLIEIGVLCNNARLENGKGEKQQGDPTEIALLQAGALLDLRRPDLLEDKPEEREESFSPETMMMATFHRVNSDLEVAVKGAPEEVLRACDRIATEDGDGARDLEENERRDWIERSEALAADGLRLLGIADKRVQSVEAEPYTDLRFLGILCLVDPVRSGVKDSITACQNAGMRVIMVTGDKPETGMAIGKELGLVSDDGASVMVGSDLLHSDRMASEERDQVLETDIFARVLPEHKLNLIQVFQNSGEVVAMTGDGVNDAPALKKADIGIAMGRRGTEAARQVADMVLKDDAMSSIGAAVEQGRIIFDNIRKSLLFMLCTNVAEVIAVGLAALAAAPLPLKPLQILYLNVITDVFPALALSVGPGGRHVMQRPPRDAGEPILTRVHWKLIVVWGLGIAACVLAGLALASEWLELSRMEAVTVSFLTLGFGKLWFVFNLREPGSRFLDNEIVRNRWIWAALILCAVLLFSAVYLPPLAFFLDTRPLDFNGWGLALALSLAPFVVGQTMRAFQKDTD